MLSAACRARPGYDIALTTARAEIEHQLREMEEAARQKDADRFAIADTLITISTPDGHADTRSRVEFVEDQRQRWNAVIETKQFELVLDSLSVRADTAVVYTRHKWERVVRDAQGELHTRLTRATHRETWIRRAEGWRTRLVHILSQGPNYLDGKPQP